MKFQSIRYDATGAVQTFEVPASGHYWVEAASALARGGRFLSKGLFYLLQNDILRIVVGRGAQTGSLAPVRGAGQGGCSFVWQRGGDLGCAHNIMLVATGGSALSGDFARHHGTGPSGHDGYVLITAAAARPRRDDCDHDRRAGLACSPPGTHSARPPSGASTDWMDSPSFGSSP